MQTAKLFDGNVEQAACTRTAGSRAMRVSLRPVRRNVRKGSMQMKTSLKLIMGLAVISALAGCTSSNPYVGQWHCKPKSITLDVLSNGRAVATQHHDNMSLTWTLNNNGVLELTTIEETPEKATAIIDSEGRLVTTDTSRGTTVIFSRQDANQSASD
jgi:hypothetical protein